MFYDLNVPWTNNQAELQRTLAFLAELDYNVVALTHTITGKLPPDLTSPIPNILPFPTPPELRLLRRCTLLLTDPSQNHRLSTLASHYDILCLRPTTERALLQACQSLDSDLISLDLSTRFPFHFKHKTLSLALQRGIKFEICYAPGVLANDGGMARRNLIGNATQLIRATRGKGIIISSEAHRALACRGPWDVVNLAAVWGLGQERGREAVGREVRAVVVQAEMKRRSYRGVVDVVYGGEKPEATAKNMGGGATGTGPGKGKRNADDMQNGSAGHDEVANPVSKREQKRQAKKARLEATMHGGPDNEQEKGSLVAPEDASKATTAPLQAEGNTNNVEKEETEKMSPKGKRKADALENNDDDEQEEDVKSSEMARLEATFGTEGPDPGIRDLDKKETSKTNGKGKKNAGAMGNSIDAPSGGVKLVSKSELKRQAKRARLEGAKSRNASEGNETIQGTPQDKSHGTTTLRGEAG